MVNSFVARRRRSYNKCIRILLRLGSESEHNELADRMLTKILARTRNTGPSSMISNPLRSIILEQAVTGNFQS
jgi:hypothetical protein